jgi:hypothetical protein
MYQCKYDRDFSSDESNGAGINNWIPVKNSHAGNIRPKKTQRSNSQITLIVLRFLVTSDKATTSIPKVHKALRVQRNRPNTQKKHSVLLVGDSHIRGIVERLAIKRRSSALQVMLNQMQT